MTNKAVLGRPDRGNATLGADIIPKMPRPKRKKKGSGENFQKWDDFIKGLPRTLPWESSRSNDDRPDASNE